MLDYVILGIIQGIFEWVPISSEGILALASQAASMTANPVDLAIFLHLGTVFSVLVYFRRDWMAVLSMKDMNTLRFLVITTVVSLVLGFPLYIMVRNVTAGGLLLAVMGLGLLATSFFHRSMKSLGLGRDRLALLSGVLQAFSVIPGLSRSGSTIFGLSQGKLETTEILRLSYMMSVPVVVASSFYIALDTPVIVNAWPSLIVSFIAGLASLSLIMRLVNRINFFWFTFVFAVLCFFGAGITILA